MDGNTSLSDPSIQGELKMRIPENLKDWIVYDWDLITRQQKLALLPAKLTVTQITDNFLAHVKKGKTLSTSQESSLITTLHCFKIYFNRMLGMELLYEFEIPQYSKIIKDYPGIEMSDVYGSIHLFRLFTRMESITSHCTMPEASLKEFMKYIHQLMKYMISKGAALFSLLDYNDATPAYHIKYGREPAYRRDIYAHPRKSKNTTK